MKRKATKTSPINWKIFTSINSLMTNSFGRSDRIRTCDPLLPKQMRYQTALHSVVSGTGIEPVCSVKSGGF